MKTLALLSFFLGFTSILSAQCPTAGNDTSATYCKQEQFDLLTLRSSDADTNGIVLDPGEDTITNTVTALNFPGQYHFFYIVDDINDTGCPADSAEFVITIINCWFGIDEAVIESHALIKANPVHDCLFLNSSHNEPLEILDLSGRRILSLAAAPGQTVDVSKLESGNHLLIAEKNGTKQFQRFIKQ